jgi:Fur family ferric uptake transcriptional regulator
VVTLSPSAPRIHFDDLDSALSALREQGLRVSISRRLVLQALFAADGPVSAERIAGGLEETESELDVTSVYRNLEAFERVGIVRHVHLGHGPGLYMLVGEGEREYLFCEGCGRAQAFEPRRLDAVRDAVRDGFGYEVRFTHFPLVGLCPECQAAAAAES